MTLPILTWSGTVVFMLVLLLITWRSCRQSRRDFEESKRRVDRELRASKPKE